VLINYDDILVIESLLFISDKIFLIENFISYFFQKPNGSVTISDTNQ